MGIKYVLVRLEQIQKNVRETKFKLEDKVAKFYSSLSLNPDMKTKLSIPNVDINCTLFDFFQLESKPIYF